MIKLIIGLLFLIILVLLAVLVVQKDPGFMLIQYGDFSLETSLAFGIVILVAAGVVLQIILRIGFSFIRLPRSMRARKQRRRTEKARRLLNQGLIDLAEGRFSQSETTLVKLIDYAETPLINYLAAARAAQQLGRYDQRDNYLKSAHDANPEAEVAIGVTQAELQLTAQQSERALATLTHLRTIVPKHDYILKLLGRVYFQIEDWSRLCELLPEIRKKQLFNDDKLSEFETRAYVGCLNQAVITEGDSLDKVWSRIPKTHQTGADLLLRYIELAEMHAEDTRQVEQLLVKSINQQWDPRLVDFYGRLKVDDTSAQLAVAEKWLQEYGNSDLLLLALGRICIRLKLWGKAQNYLEASIGIKPQAQACLELAELLEREELDQRDKACQYYQQGLKLSLNAGGDQYLPHGL